MSNVMNSQDRRAKALALCISVAAALVLSACNSGDTVVDTRGKVDSSSDIVTLSRTTLDATASAGGYAALTSAAQCDVVVKRVNYQTLGGLREATTATTLVAVPTGGTAATCDGKRPVMLYAHGTSELKSKNMASGTDTEAALVMGMFAAQGYVVVAPNYTGYTGSSLPYHPYLIAEAHAYDAVDALRAAKTELDKQTRVSLGKLFVSGYSQGGFAAMATVRALERDYRVEWPLAGSMPMSGPYDLSGFATTVMSGTANLGGTLFTPMLVDAYQAVYKNIYTNANAIYNAPFDVSTIGLFPGSTDYGTALGSGKVPANLTGAGGLLLDSYVASFLATTGNTNTLLANLKANTLQNFRPVAKMNLCYGSGDPVVFASNSTTLRDYFKNTLAVSVGDFDLDSTTAFEASVEPVRQAWLATKAAGGSAFTASYHGAAAAFCLAIAKQKFDAIANN